MSDALVNWVIYDHPKDYPDGFIARKWLVEREGITATNETITGSTLAEVRAELPYGLACLPRFPDDDPRIVEIWL